MRGNILQQRPFLATVASTIPLPNAQGFVLRAGACFWWFRCASHVEGGGVRQCLNLEARLMSVVLEERVWTEDRLHLRAALEHCLYGPWWVSGTGGRDVRLGDLCRRACPRGEEVGESTGVERV